MRILKSLIITSNKNGWENLFDLIQNARHFQISINTCEKLKDGLEELRKNHYDVLFLDQRLIKTKNRRVLKEIRDERPGTLVVLLIRGRKGSSVEEMINDNEIDDYFSKEEINSAFITHTFRIVDRLKKTAMIQSEYREKYNAVINSNLVGIMIVDSEEKIVFVNDSLAKILGYKKEHLLKKSLSKFTDRDEFIKYQKFTKRRIKGHADQYESRLYKKDGSPVPMLFSASPFVTPENEYRGSLTIVVEISDLKKTEAALKENQRMLSTLLGNLPGMAYRCRDDEKRTIEFASKGCEEITGYIAEDLVENKRIAYFDLIHPDDKKYVQYSIQNSVKKKIAYKMIYRINTRDDKERWVWEQGRPVENIGRSTYALEGFIADISERIYAEEALRESEEKFRSLISSAPYGIIISNIRGEVVDVNKAAETMLDIKRDEIINRKLKSWIPKISNLLKNKGEDSPTVKEIVITPKKNIKKYLETTISPINLDNGKTNNYVLILRDITEQKLIESELQKTQKLESLGMLAGGIAHDFNNLLAAILSNLNLSIIYSSKNKQLYEKLGDAKIAVEKAKDLMHNLITFSKGDVQYPEEVDLKKLITDSVRLVLRDKNIEHKICIPDDIPSLNVDKSQISQVINNLLINAEQAMPNGGEINISVEAIKSGKKEIAQLENKEYVKIIIKDNGVGINEEEEEKIFDPFFTTKEKGSGLGLAVTYSIIKKHNGYISFDSEEGTGTTFYIYLPAYEKVMDKISSKIKKRKKGQKRVLIMDDEPLVLDSTREVIEKLGYEVETSKEGLEMLSSFKRSVEENNPFDVVILDLSVSGGMGGREAAKILKTLRPEIKIIASTGYHDELFMQNYKEYGFEYVLKKPFDIEKINQLLLKI